MGRNFSNLTKASVEAGHWALWEKPDDVNAILKDWLDKQVFGAKSSL
jgi:soluble epoxide hydrolase/lipid-phosphate phosphatase